jgi:hypothetical protein
VTWWSQWRRGRFWAEVVLAVVVGVAAFVVAAVVSTAARSHVPAALLGLLLLLLLVVLAVARFAGILYALPVGVVTIEAFDWYFLPRCATSTGPPCSCSACSWPCQSSSAGSRLRPAAARPGQNGHGAYWPRSRRRCGGWRHWSPASPRPRRSSPR